VNPRKSLQAQLLKKRVISPFSKIVAVMKDDPPPRLQFNFILMDDSQDCL
jgi:hypothetical protein